MIRRVLLGIGGTPFSDVAIQYAVAVARSSGASVTAVTVVDESRLGRTGPVPLGGGAAAAELRDHRLEVTRERIEDTLDQLRRLCGENGVPVDVQREQGSPFRLMVDHSRYHDLAIFGLRSMFEYPVLGDADVEPASLIKDLVEGGVRPLLAVPGQYRAIRRVLIAHSGSVQAAQSMKHFVRFRLWPDVTLRILVCEHPQDQGEQLLADAAAYCRAHGYEPETRYWAGEAKQGILAEIGEWNADLLVIGSSARSWLAAVFLGTTMLHLVRHSECALFVGT